MASYPVGAETGIATRSRRATLLASYLLGQVVLTRASLAYPALRLNIVAPCSSALFACERELAP